MSHIILAKAWNNGKFLPNGGGYGVWLTNYFKDEYLDVEWASVILELEGWEKIAELGTTPMLSGPAEESSAAESSASG